MTILPPDKTNVILLSILLPLAFLLVIGGVFLLYCRRRRRLGDYALLETDPGRYPSLPAALPSCAAVAHLNLRLRAPLFLPWRVSSAARAASRWARASRRRPTR